LELVSFPSGSAHLAVSLDRLPDLASAEAVLEGAQKIGPGETARRAAERPASAAMALPSAAEVTAVYNTVLAQHNASLTAQAFTDLQQNEIGALYPEAQRLAVQLCNTVEYRLENDDAYQTLDDAGRLAVARRWGLVYIYDPAETPDPDDDNAANTTLPARHPYLRKVNLASYAIHPMNYLCVPRMCWGTESFLIYVAWPTDAMDAFFGEEYLLPRRRGLEPPTL